MRVQSLSKLVLAALFLFLFSACDKNQISGSLLNGSTQGPQSSISILSFSANPTGINQGQSATLSWNISGASSASIDNGVGPVNSVNGSVQVTPSQTTTYTLTAQGSSGTVTAQATVTVSGGQAQVPTINSFTVTSSQINWGQSTTLNWNISNATSATITPTVAGVNPAAGTFQVSPLTTTIYTLVAMSSVGTVSSQVTLTVVQPAPTPQPSPNPSAPLTPTTFRVDVSEGTTGQLFLTWDSMSGATYYNLQRSTDALSYSAVSACSGPGTKFAQSSNSVICRDPGLTPGTSYYYQVQACNSSGCSWFAPAFVNSPVSSNCTNGPGGQIPDLSGLKTPRSAGIAANIIDSLVQFQPTDLEYFSYPTSGVAHQNLLVVEMPGTGSSCGNGSVFADTAKNLGYDYMCVNYPNSSEQDQICAGNLACFGNVSQAKLSGTGSCICGSTQDTQTNCGQDPHNGGNPYCMPVEKDGLAHDDITVRITMFLQYLINNGYNKNGTNWGQYLNGSVPNWSKLVIGGFSQGGVMGAYAAYNYPVARVHMRSSPPAATQLNGQGQFIAVSWLSQIPKQTNIRNFYGLVSANDPRYSEGNYNIVWQSLGFTAANNDAEVKLSSSVGLNCNQGVPSHNLSTSFIQSAAGGHPDTISPWNEDAYKFILNISGF